MDIGLLLPHAVDLSDSPITIVEPGPQRGRGPRIVYANPAFGRLTGHPPADCRGRPAFFFCPDASPLDRAADQDGGAKRLVLSGLRYDGRPLEVEARIHPVAGPDGRTAGLVIVHRDRRRDHAGGRVPDQTEAESAAKSRFLASASHDLRQPLNAISLLMGMLRPQVRDETVAPIIDQIQHSLDEMMELFDGLLEISRFETQGVSANPAPQPIGRLFDRLHMDFAEQARLKGVRLRVVGCRAEARTDPFLIERMLRNLVGDAIRHTPAGGSVLLGCRRRGDALRIDVIDTGPGLPDAAGRAATADDPRPFDDPAPRRSEGIDPGLAIVKRASALLGHRIEIVSRIGRGSRFSVLVERSAAAGPRLGAPAPPAGAADGACRVLMVEDDPLVAAAMRMLLEGMGCTVDEAGDGAAAIEAVTAANAPPRLVVADYRLPGRQDGIDTITAVRTLAGRPIPAAIVTGDLSPDIRNRAEAIGVRCLAKPIRPDAIQALVTSVM